MSVDETGDDRATGEIDVARVSVRCNPFVEL
jgi:hypothetical protein